MLDGCLRRSTCSTIMSGNENSFSMSFRNTCSNSAYSGFCNQLDTDVSIGVCIMKIKYQLLQVFNGINIVMWWWRYQSHTWCRMSDLSDILTDFMSW